MDEWWNGWIVEWMDGLIDWRMEHLDWNKIKVTHKHINKQTNEIKLNYN